MKNLAIPLTVAVLGAMILTSGCVPKDKYDEALAANRRTQAQLDQNLAALQQMRVKNDALGRDLQDRDATITKMKNEIVLLESQSKLLKDNFGKLKTEYDKLLASKGPAPISINVLPAPVDAALQAFAKANPELVEYLREYGMVKIKADLTFDKGSDVVKSAAEKVLTKLVEIINSDAAKKFNVYVAGHTDDIPIRRAATLAKHRDNWYLSVHRAIAVEKVLSKAGLAAERIGAMGFGEYHPVAPNKAGKRGNPLNRRVEIWIVPPNRFLTSANDSEK